MDSLLRSKSNRISDLFFSDYNVNILQDAIRYRVWVESNRTLMIGRQSDRELSIVMRSIYISESKNREDSESMVVQQVKQLNKLVLDYCVPQIVREGDMYRKYTSDASSLPVPLERGKLATKKGDNSLDMSRLLEI
jgi:hypothetical protein